MRRKAKRIVNQVRVAWFLARRLILRSSRATTILVIGVMTLTFINLVGVSGLLVGIIDGSFKAYRAQSSGDVIIIPNDGERDVSQTPRIVETLRAMPGVTGVSARYTGGATIEGDYYKRINDPSVQPDTASGFLRGVDPSDEEAVTNLSSLIIEGSMLEEGEEGWIVIGSDLLKRLASFESPGFTAMSGGEVGDRVLLTVGETTVEMRVKGVVKSKVGDIRASVFVTANEARRLNGANGFDAQEIAVRIAPDADRTLVVANLKSLGFASYGKILLSEESIGSFLDQIRMTFSLLGIVLGFISLVVASITVFIVIFITAFTRRKYIGILKGIGIDEKAIELSYVFLAAVYAIIGIAIGWALVYGFLQPLVAAYPIDFPFSDGILSAPIDETLARTVIIFLATLLAGYLPARSIVRKKALDAILGR